jgi:C4-dicarboxylate-specific signal transduction histidine kinase/competence protein ComGC
MPGAPLHDKETMLHQLRYKLFFIFATLAIIPLLILSIAGYMTLRRHLIQTTSQNLLALTRLQKSQFHTYLLEKQELITALSERGSKWNEALRQLMRTQSAASTQHNPHLALLLQRNTQNSGITSLAIYHQSGSRLFVAKPWSHRYPKSLQLPQPTRVHILGLQHFHKASDTTLRMAAPIQLQPGQTVWMVVDFPFVLHQRFLQEKKGPAFQGDIYLLNQAQNVLCGSLDIHHLHQASKQPKTIPFLTQETPHPWGRVHRYQTPSGDRYIGVAIPIPQHKWILLVELPETKMFRPLQQLWLGGLLLLFVVIALVIALIAFFSSRLINPLQQLVQATTALSKGTFTHPLPPPTQDEIGELTRSFDHMRQELQESYNNLEANVAKRTKELEESERFSELLFHSIPEVIVVTDKTLRVIKANKRARALFGDEIIGAFCYHVFEGEGATASSCIAATVLETGQPGSSEDNIPHPKNGELFYKDFYPIFDQENNVIGVLESAKIITHQKQLLAQLVHQEKMAALGLFASGVGHEIGNPLASIFALTQRLQYKAPNEETKTIASELEERCLSIMRILETLSNYAKKSPEHTTPLSLHEEIDQALALVRFDRRLNNVDLQVQHSAELPLLWGRKGAISQIATNLLLNALDAVESNQQPIIAIKTWPGGEGVYMSVTDNGHGLQTGDETQVFEPFFTTKSQTKGTGLGLSVCKQLAEQLGGTIRAYNRPEHGAVFELFLPGEQGTQDKGPTPGETAA